MPPGRAEGLRARFLPKDKDAAAGDGSAKAAPAPAAAADATPAYPPEFVHRRLLVFAGIVIGCAAEGARFQQQADA
jgi:hypothetical protein